MSAMQPPISSRIQLIPGAIAELFADCTATGNLTWADRYGLMAAILSEQLSEDERRAVDRLLRAVRQGRIIPTDDLSALS